MWGWSVVNCEYCKIKIVFCSTRHATRVSQYHAVWSWCSMSLFTSIRQHTNYRSILWYPHQEGILQLSIRCRTSKFQFFQFFSKRFFPLLFPTSLQYQLPTERYMFMYLPSPVTGSTRILPAPTNSNLGRQNTRRNATYHPPSLILPSHHNCIGILTTSIQYLLHCTQYHYPFSQQH